MSENYYRTGQAAKQLGLSSYQIRRLCECGLIDAELTNGRQWRIPASEVARLRKEGVPPIPQSLNDEAQPPEVMLLNRSANGYQSDSHGSGRPTSQRLYSPPSATLIQSAEQVAITENLVRKRRLEREFEEVEDFFRDRERNQRAELAAERRRAAEIIAERNRRAWRDKWLRYALNSAPWDAPKGIELNIHRAVEDTLTKLDPDQPEDLVGQLVDAAVERALIPWQHAQAREGALNATLVGLPWGIQYDSDFADLKQRALYLATEMLDGQPQSATDWELRDAARQAVQPVIEEYEHREACERIVASLSLRGATTDELEDARTAARETLTQLPIGSTQRRLDQARELARRFELELPRARKRISGKGL